MTAAPLRCRLLLLGMVTLLSQAGAVNDVTAPESKPINVEFYYSTLCPHCLAFLRGAMLRLVEARLPGDQVQIMITPLVPPQVMGATCKTDPMCWGAVAPLCALNSTRFMPLPADSPELLNAARFLACEIEDTVGRTGAGEVWLESEFKHCADKAKLPWEGPDGMQQCAFQDVAGLSLLDISKFKQMMMAQRFGHMGFANFPGIPWVIVDGEFLDCHDFDCLAIIKPQGNVPLPKPCSFLSFVCSKLEGSPAACAKVPHCPSMADKDQKTANNGVPKLKPCKKCEKDAEEIAKSVKFDKDLATCPGETRGNKKCDTGSYRVCMKLLGDDGKPLVFGGGMTWWQWSKQTNIQWDDAMRKIGGDSWCTCGLCSTEAVEKFGCDRIHIKCDATDGAFVSAAPLVDDTYAPLKACILKKCPGIISNTSSLYDIHFQTPAAAVDDQLDDRTLAAGAVLMGIAAFAMVAVRWMPSRRARSTRTINVEQNEEDMEVAVE